MDIESIYETLRPAFPLISTEDSERAIKNSIISLILNAAKRTGHPNPSDDLTTRMAEWNFIVGGKAYEDLRLHLLFVGEGGSGKSSLMSTMMNLNPFSTIFKTGTPHHDQLIGSTEKIWNKKEQEMKFIPYPGELSSDMYINDEALETFTNPKNQQSRAFFRQAASKLGTSNRLTKNQVRVPLEFAVDYWAEPTLILGFQPASVPMDIITMGDMRRFQIVPVKFALNEKESIFRWSGHGNGEQRSEAITSGRQFLSQVRKKYDIRVGTGVEGMLKTEMQRIKTQFFLGGFKTIRYYTQAYLDIQTQILRHAFVHSLLRHDLSRSVIIEVKDVEKAMDLFYPSSIDTAAWINNHVMAERDVVVPLRDREKKRASDVVEHMKRLGAREKRTALPVEQVKRWIIGKGWYKNENSMKRFWNSLIKFNILRTEKVGKVWVTWIGSNGYTVVEEESEVE